MSKRIEFLASIPPYRSAIQISGEDGGQVKLDVPEQYIDALADLRKMRRRVLKITIEETPRRLAPKALKEPEWGDDDDEASDDTG